MIHYVGTILCILVVLWICARLVIWLLQFILRTCFGLVVRIGKVGFFSLHKIRIQVKQGLTLEVDQVWISSFKKKEARKLVTVCFQDVRIQANVLKEEDNQGRIVETKTAGNGKRNGLNISKFVHVLKHIGIKVDNLTIMLLKTMIPDCLIHITAQAVGLDISDYDNRLNCKLDLHGILCRTLQSTMQEEASHPCLGEMSFNFLLDFSSHRQDITHIQSLRIITDKPQMEITEGLLNSLHSTLQNSRQEKKIEVSQEDDSPTENESVPPDLLRYLPEEIGIDVTELDVRIIRQTKQRTLSVCLKALHTDLYSQVLSESEVNISASLLLQEFQTSSSQANFAELQKFKFSSKVGNSTADVAVDVYGGFFHYHHEEVQYWMMVLNKFIHTDSEKTPSPSKKSSIVPKLRENLHQVLENYKFIVYVQVNEVSHQISTASCSGFHSGVKSIVFNLYVSSTEQECGAWFELHDITWELELNTIYCCLTDSRVDDHELMADIHYWNYILYMGRFKSRFKKMKTDIDVFGRTENLQLEWSTNAVNSLIQILSSLSKIKQTMSFFSSSPGVSEKKKSSSSNINTIDFKFDVYGVNIYICNMYEVYLVSRLEKLVLDYTNMKSIANLTGIKVRYMEKIKKYTSVMKFHAEEDPIAALEEFSFTIGHVEKQFNIQINKEGFCLWSTKVHMCIQQMLQDIKDVKSRIAAEILNSDEENKIVPEVPVEAKSRYKVNLNVDARIGLTLQLSSNHSIKIIPDTIVLTTSPDFIMKVEKVTILCDTEKVFTLQGIMFECLHEKYLQRQRAAYTALSARTNRAWNLNFSSIGILFPYQYDFAACFQEMVNVQKWLKLVHKVEKKPFTEDSPLPSDLQIIVKSFTVQINDDPFEVKLGDNYELMKDEFSEQEKREQVLEQKILTIRKEKKFVFPTDKIAELYDSLSKKNAEIYIQRNKQLYSLSPMRTKLFTFTMTDFEIVAFADKTLHGKENVVNKMREIDPDSPLPEEGLEFTSLWCRMVNFNLQHWSIYLRDYQQPALEIEDMHVWGCLIGAEQKGSKQAIRTCEVEVGQPWGNMSVERNMPALKFYHDLSCDMQSYTMAHGACWEPVLAQFNLCLNLINKPSIDPSRQLPFWDKIRLFFHGRFTMTVGQMSWLYHASLNPYNTTELLDWTWSDVILEWKNGMLNYVHCYRISAPTNTSTLKALIILKGDLDINSRTASKYDDCKMLHLPNVKIVIRLQWLCNGDPNDHHSVMPCAPDKVPDYSLEGHDSFGAFRSQNFNADVSLETHPVKCDSIEKIRNTPNCLFYSSTLRLLEKFKMCILKVTRPIRRGTYFHTTTPRKQQLSRHYKQVKISVNFHQFIIRYWMSFAKQLGFELLANSFTLKTCDELNIHLVDDGLKHRPQAVWSVKYLTCDLGSSTLWLCKSGIVIGSEDDQNIADKSFFLGLSGVSYHRAESTDLETEMDSETFQKEKEIPTHQVKLFELKGSWNRKNRIVLFGLYDAYYKFNSLKKNLSADALKAFKVDNTTGQQGTRSKSTSFNLGQSSPTSTTMTSPFSQMQTGHAYSMLMKLVAESDTKSVAFTEEPSSSHVDQLHGVACCQTDDVLRKKWLIELHNSQMVLKGCETKGYMIVSAGKAQILNCLHRPIQRNGHLRSKTTWVGSVECMQYYATVNPEQDYSESDVTWLPKENVEDRVDGNVGILPEMISSGNSVGGVVTANTAPEKVIEDDEEEQPAVKEGVTMQRVISRCKCQIFYAHYGEIEDELVQHATLDGKDDDDMMKREEGIETFTLLHHDLNICTNSPQYEMVLDIVNNVLLYVEPKWKEATEKLQSMRFQLQLSGAEDQKTPILVLQENVRKYTQKLRRLEKELYLVLRAQESGKDEDPTYLDKEKEALDASLYECKEQIYLLNEELTIRISCLKESQMQLNAQENTTKESQVLLARKNEVCFKFAQWRLTDEDGQVGIADLALRNFVYTKDNRDDDSWTHQLELGWLKATNLLPNTIYKDVLSPRDSLFNETENRQMALRIICSERPPVGGIAIKEHFEINLVPLQIQMTYNFYKTVMRFFFPEKEIQKETGTADTGKKKVKKSTSKEKKDSTAKRNLIQAGDDDIDRMKERAANNQTFIYTKMPEVSLKVSYKTIQTWITLEPTHGAGSDDIHVHMVLQREEGISLGLGGLFQGIGEKNIQDIRDFGFTVPTLEYHNCIWTWYDLWMAMKNDCKKILLSQAIKQKLHMKSRAGDEPQPTDVQQEEDKAKMLLGAKFLAGQDKPAKKSLFGKSQKP